MIKYLRGLPGPVWSMALWSLGQFLNISVLSTLITGPVHMDANWALGAAFELSIAAICLVWGARTPGWFLLGIVAARILVVFAIAAASGVGDVVVTGAFNSIIAVVYVGYWWHSRITYLYAGLASGCFLVLIHVTNSTQTQTQAWFVLSTLVFGLAFGLVKVVGANEQRAKHDPLTGLLNRLGLEDYLELHPRAGRVVLPRTMAVIDLDGFKAINDSHGHVVGDRTLRDTAAAWRTALRPDDIAVRIGGDEFLLILPKTDNRGAAALIARLRDVSPTTWSCGITHWLADEDFDEALARADGLMYQAKNFGPHAPER